MDATLYEKLGVSPTATQDEIKTAYKRLAHEHHPDKAGGDAEKFSDLAHAYRVLRDPGSRLLYDKTGDDGQVNWEAEVQTTLLQSFQDALAKDAPQILVHARKFFLDGCARFEKQKADIRKARKKLQDRRDRVRVSKDGVQNLFHLLIDKELVNMRNAVEACNHQIKLGKHCLKVLEDYESTETPPDVIKHTMVWMDESGMTVNINSSVTGAPDLGEMLRRSIQENKERKR